MKYLLTAILSIFLMSGFAQTEGSIKPKSPFPQAGKANVFIYTPKKGLIIPDGAQAFVAFNTKTFSAKFIPLSKKDNTYEFSLETPDSTQAFITAIYSGNKKPLDNNEDNGYTTVLYDKNGKKFPLTNSSLANLLGGIGGMYLGLKPNPKNIVSLYEKELTENPDAKDKIYLGYLFALNKLKKDTANSLLLEYAKTLESSNDEVKMGSALNVFSSLKQKEEAGKLEEKILAAFPKGRLASSKILQKLRTAKTPEDILNVQKEYYEKITDTATAVNDQFTSSLIQAYGNKKDWANFFKYSELISDKNNLDNVYNSIAWKLSGESLSTPGEELETAKIISASSLQFVQNKIANEKFYSNKNLFIGQTFKEAMESYYGMFADTYALILYKLGKYDSAFHYESIAVKDLEKADKEELERYAIFAEKVKGDKFIQKFLEDQVSSGKASIAMKDQLKSIYKKLNISDSEFEKLAAQGAVKTKEKVLKEIEAKKKNYVAPTFTLKNLNGETVSLANYKGKVVVIDFWATWCGPCKASFPGMQKALTKYANDKDVVFLFVDTWEHKDAEPMKKDAAKFIDDNKYTFNVLLDEKDNVITSYKVDGIPTKFIIDRTGKVRYMSVGFNGSDDALIEEISLMIEDAKK